MTDKELLELAAKVAGIDAEFHTEFGDTSYAEGMWLKGKRSPDNSKYWNPLTSDADALRLAVKLEMLVDVMEGVSGAQVVEVVFCSEPHGNDPYAATRRAIVRAAAEVGRLQA